MFQRRLGYLSGAPRVSTHAEAEASGPRSHVLGVIRAFEALGWEVQPFIVGNRVPRKWVTKGSEESVSKGFMYTLAVDCIRLVMNAVNTRRAWKELGNQVDWVYERFGSFQILGQRFKQRGVLWILETNAPLYKEAKLELKTLALSGLARRLEVQAYQQCDVIVCVSQALKELILQESGVPEEKILVIPNGVDTEFFNPDNHPPKRLFEGFTVGFVGSLSIWQGLDLLLKALSTLQDEEGVKMNLAIVGHGPMQQELEALARNLGLYSQVRFLGQFPQAELPPLIAGFDVGYSGHLDLQGRKVYRSPLKLYEYMAMGKPVVASAAEDTQLLVREGETGFLFSPGDSEELQQALLKAYRVWQHLGEMGCKAREEVVVNHSWITRMQKVIAGVEQILKMEKS